MLQSRFTCTILLSEVAIFGGPHVTYNGLGVFARKLEMLNLCFKNGDYAFVYHQGCPVGAILVGDMRAGARRSRVSLLFSGRKQEFEILRPTVVASRFGSEELERLVKEFVL